MLIKHRNKRSPGGDVSIVRRYPEYGVSVEVVGTGLEIAESAEVESPIDHGTLSGLGDDDHSQYILHSLADAADDFLVADADDNFVRKTLAETGAILEGDIEHGNIQGLGDDDHTQYLLTADTRKTTTLDMTIEEQFLLNYMSQ